jgi:hypothetical protein
MSEAPNGEFISQQELAANDLDLHAELNVTRREMEAVLKGREIYRGINLFDEGVPVPVLPKSDRNFLDEQRALAENGLAA